MICILINIAFHMLHRRKAQPAALLCSTASRHQNRIQMILRLLHFKLLLCEDRGLPLWQTQLRVSEASAEVRRRAADAEAAAEAAQQQLAAQRQETAAAEAAAVEARSRVATLHAQLAQRYAIQQESLACDVCLWRCRKPRGLGVLHKAQ